MKDREAEHGLIFWQDRFLGHTPRHQIIHVKGDSLAAPHTSSARCTIDRTTNHTDRPGHSHRSDSVMDEDFPFSFGNVSDGDEGPDSLFCAPKQKASASRAKLLAEQESYHAHIEEDGVRIMDLQPRSAY